MNESELYNEHYNNFGKMNILDNKVMKDKLYDISNMVVEDREMLNILKMATKVSKVDTTVLILGETGVGKEGIAKYIHCNSNRKNNPFITINCGAIPENLIESELFGYESGAFTGANKGGKMGLFQLAHGGTIFLDEVGELPLEVQVKLLRVLQEHQIERVGSINSIKVDLRVVAATNKNLIELIEKNKFREDLYYRLSVFPIEIPPLRERKDDIVPLINYFLKDINDQYGFVSSFSEEAIKCLCEYSWPGNVRELRNIIERSIVMNGNTIIQRKDLPECINGFEVEQEFIFGINNFSIKGCSLKEFTQKIEFEIIEDAVERYGNIRMAAKALGIDPSTLIRKRNKNIKRHDE
ncbi:sigma-54 interaction domain-containing protein [Clostridium frigidicarnis]|uniref:HTH-type transcriptional regulatory protein TyrR n=1 Tax=Clostridium frigidicarnis TaxID=84698 RepID=A0A1I0XVE8_9CLOT|nr:sigma 54-interacting transcriptional regulator [Clostridium frigidicarnis]SFB05035.1 regulatory protein, Fis family [Clostridium frigidicarnis]